MERSPMAAIACCPIFIKDGSKIIPVNPLHIKRIESDRDYVKIVLANPLQKKYAPVFMQRFMLLNQ